MEENTEANLGQHAIKWGLILGFVTIIINLVIYLIDITLMAESFLIGFIMLAVSIGILIYSGIDFRKQSGGFLSFGKAFQHAFFALIVSGLLLLIFRYLLFNVIDPEATEILIRSAMEKSAEMMETFGAQTSAEMMDGMEEGIRNSYSIGGMATGFLWSLVMYAIGALIVGAITKKKEPIEDY